MVRPRAAVRPPLSCQAVPIARQPVAPDGTASILWPDGGRHRWTAGQAVDAHSHERGHLVYAASGVLSVHTQRGTSIVPADRVAWVPAGVQHFHRAHASTDMRILFLPRSCEDLMPVGAVVLPTDGLTRELLLTLTGPRGYGQSDAATRGQLARLQRALVEELRVAREQPLLIPEPVDDRLRNIARRLQVDPADNSSLEAHGRRVGASPRTLSRLMQRELGMTFYQWRTLLRLAHALTLLADGQDITAVGHACGWRIPSGFIAAFADVIGTTPGRYQQQ